MTTTSAVVSQARAHWRANLTQPRVVALLLLLFIVYVAARSADFWTLSNWQILVQPLAEAGLVALGMTAVIASGGIDISVGSIIGLASVVASPLAIHGHGLLFTAAAAIGAGALCGAFNGVLIGVFGLAPILVTLGTMIFYSGLALTISKGASFTGFPDSVLRIADVTVGPVPLSFIVFCLCAAALALVLRSTVWGAEVVAYGSNPVAAHFSGMHIKRALFTTYTLQGALCGLVALLMIARLASARADMGQSLMLISIAAVVLGGTPITGGALSIAGTVLGAATFYVIENGLTLLDVSPFLRSTLVAAVLLAAVTIGNVLAPAREER